jgi:hypothetical protein
VEEFASKEEVRDIRQNCKQTHDDTNKCLTDIKVILGRMDERMNQAFGQLKDGSSTFASLGDRVDKLENLEERRKGVLIAISAVVAVIMNVVYLVVKSTLDKILKGGA